MFRAFQIQLEGLVVVISSNIALSATNFIQKYLHVNCFLQTCSIFEQHAQKHLNEHGIQHLSITFKLQK